MRPLCRVFRDFAYEAGPILACPVRLRQRFVASVDVSRCRVYLRRACHPFRPSWRIVSVHARIAVLASGGGTNLQALIDRLNGGGSDAARVELVVGSRAGIGALERAERAGIPALALDARAM